MGGAQGVVHYNWNNFLRGSFGFWSWPAGGEMEGGESIVSHTRCILNIMRSSSPYIDVVTLDTFINFLVLCESNGYIELKLSLKEVRDQV